MEIIGLLRVAAFVVCAVGLLLVYVTVAGVRTYAF